MFKIKNCSIFLCLIIIFVNKSRANLNDSTSQIQTLTKSYIEEEIGTTTNKIDLDVEANSSRSYFPPDLHRIYLALNSLPDGLCRNESQIVLESIISREKWALKIFDSSPKFPVGILYGTQFQLGNFDECVSSRQPEAPNIQGKYCLADVALYPQIESGNERYARSHGKFYEYELSTRLTFNKTVHWAICVPSSCKPNEVKIFLNQIFKTAISNRPVTIEVGDRKCHYEKEIPITNLEIAYLVAVGGFVTIILLATIYHYVLIRKNAISESSDALISTEIIVSFSLIKSVGKLIHLGESEFDLQFISGLKFSAMLLIIASHSLVFVIGGPIMNDEFYLRSVKKVQNSIFVNNPLLVDVFLLLSGFLMCRLLLLELDKRKGQINILVLYIGRYIRLTPAYAVVLGLYCTSFVRIDNGPLWDSVIMREQDRCLNSWWTNILYINNYVNTDSICMFQSWYLSADTQLFMIAPFIIYPLYKWPRKGELLLALSTIVAVVIPFVVTYVYKLDPTFMGYPIELTDLTTNYYFVFAYIKTHMRAVSYCIGLIAGYLVYKMQASNYKIRKSVVYVCWILSTVFGLSSMISVIAFYHPEYEYGVFEASVYSSLHKLAWSLFIAWIIIACVTDNSGPIRAFLSWAPFSPLSRLTYCAYLMNGFIELHGIGTIRSSTYTSVYNMAVIALAHFVLTFTCGFILCIFFESPIHSIEKLILKQERKYRSKRKDLENSKL